MPVRQVEEKPDIIENNFFSLLTSESAYVLGYFAADGCMYKNPRGSKYISFCSADKEEISLIRQLLAVNNTIEEYEPKSKNWQKRYTLQVGSKMLFRQLQDLGMTPAKSKNLIFPEIPNTSVCHFTRGYFDGDGTVYFRLYPRRDRKQIYPILQVHFTSGSREFLKSLRIKLVQLSGIGQGSLRFHDRAWRLSYSTNDSRQLYRFMYPSSTVPCLKRKRAIFEQAIEKWGP